MATVRLLNKDQVSDLVARLLGSYRVIAPAWRAGELRFDTIGSPDEAVLDYRNTTKSPKDAFFPQTETLLRYRRTLDRYDDIAEVELDQTPSSPRPATRTPASTRASTRSSPSPAWSRPCPWSRGAR